MSYSIHTALKHKLPIASISKSWGLGKENIIARMAFTISLRMDEAINFETLYDSKGKEYRAKVLFGEHQNIYEELLCKRENINKDHPNFKKYIKAHIDRGLDLISEYSTMDLPQFIDTFSSQKIL